MFLVVRFVFLKFDYLNLEFLWVVLGVQFYIFRNSNVSLFFIELGCWVCMSCLLVRYDVRGLSYFYSDSLFLENINFEIFLMM